MKMQQIVGRPILNAIPGYHVYLNVTACMLICDFCVIKVWKYFFFGVCKYDECTLMPTV
jgi:hypothetical protein